jgi:flagellar hook-associated protein 2
MRIGGLASGMDIDTLVKDLMKAERMPLDKLLQKKQVLEWQRDDYRSMNSLLLNFRNDLTQMKLTSQYRARSTTSTDDSMITATASGSASQSSATISKVTKLASSERVLSSGNVGLEASKSLHSQTSSDGMWKQGAVETKSITADGTSDTISLGVTQSTLKDFGSWSVSANGKSYKVVTDPGMLNDSSVYVDTNGSLKFNSVMAANTSVKVSYVANSRTETQKLSYNTTSIQLSGRALNDINGQQIKLIRSTKEGDVTTPQADVIFNINGNNEILDGTTVVGKIDKETGVVTINNTEFKGRGYLPPETPEAGKEYNFSLELTYDQHYTNFSMDTVTSKGSLHENFLVQGSESIQSLTSRVNNSSVGVTMFYDEFSGKMSLSRKDTGKFNTSPDGTSLGNDIATNGNLINNVFKIDFSAGTVTEGTNAILEINGIATQRNSNTFTMDGVTYTLKQTFGDVGTSNPTASPITININNDTTKVYENIVNFVNKYNEMIEKVQAKVKEDRYRTYQPLSSEEREAMTDKQQELWDEKAKSGLIRRDPILMSGLSDLRTVMYQTVSNSQVDSKYNQLVEIGIETSPNYLDGGKLIIDEAKLKAAIENDPESVENFFRGTGETEAEQGIINRLYDKVTGTMDKLKDKAGNSFSTTQSYKLGRDLDDLEGRIDRFEDRLKQVENRYWAQFTAMEKAIQKANEQSAYLMQQFGGM